MMHNIRAVTIYVVGAANGLNNVTGTSFAVILASYNVFETIGTSN